jgi:hypothetical protein
MTDDYEARKARATKVTIADESDAGLNLYLASEKHLHEGHNYELTETLHDNAVEYCVWAYCHTCKAEFWYENVGIGEVVR